MDKQNQIIKWDKMSNTNIRHELESIKEYHKSIKTQITKLLDKVDNLEKEYLLGNTILDNRQKGIH